MWVYNDDNNLIIIEPKTVYCHFNLHELVDKNLKYEIYPIIKRNGFLAE